MNLIGEKVESTKYGVGTITAIESGYVTVQFTDKVSKFKYPDAFQAKITFKNRSLQDEVCSIATNSVEKKEKNNGAVKNLWDEIKQIKAIKGLLIIAIIMPLLLCVGRHLYDVWKGAYSFEEGYDSNWLSFFGSYLGGLLGGVATLIAVVKTIQSNKEEFQRNREELAQKERQEKQSAIKENALIIYLDFKYAFENIKEFLLEFWKLHEQKHIDIKKPYDDLNDDIKFSIYKKCIIKLDQLYFDNDFVHSVAKIRDSSIGVETIWSISEIYGHLSNIIRSRETSDRMAYRIAFRSMNRLIKIKNDDLPNNLTKDNFDTRDNFKDTIDKLESIAIGSKDSEPVK